MRSVELLGSIDDAKKLFTQVVDTLKTFIARHRDTTDSALRAEAEAEIARLSGERGVLEARLKSLAGSESKLVHEYESLRKNIEREKDTNREAEKDVFRIIARQNEVRNIVTQLSGALSVLSHQEEDFKKELGEAGVIAGREAVSYTAITNDQDTITKREVQEDRRRQIERLKIRLEDAGIGSGGEVLKEYRETEERDAFLARELEDLDKARKELLQLIADLDVRIDYEFKSGILRINSEFQKFFALMFGGGKAELTVVRETKRRKRSDIEDLGEVLSDNESLMNTAVTDDEGVQGPEGLDVNISLPRKKVKGLMMLSGGERALTSIALLFAVSQVNPPPFIILDETDAALDEANSRKYGDMIESLSEHSQLILITHNRETMSRAGTLYGITMGSDGASKLLSIQFDEAVKVAK